MNNDLGSHDPNSNVINTVVRAGVIVAIVVGIRGFAVATMLDGVYRWNSFLFDALCGFAIFATLQLCDQAISRTLKHLFGSKPSMKFTAACIRLLIVVMIFGTFLLAAVQMHPSKIGCAKTPADLNIEYSQHIVPTSDGFEISIWKMPVSDSNRPVVVVTHGLGSNKQNFMAVSSAFQALNYNVVAFDFRGHGDSGGHTCTLGVDEAADVTAAANFARQQFPGCKIYGWTTSLGAAATVRSAATQSPFDKLVIDATFASVKDVAMETKFCYLGPLDDAAWQISRCWYWLFVRKDIEQFGPIRDIAEIEAPIFLIHGTADVVIPHTESDKLLAAAREGTELWKVEGAGHSASFHHPDYFDRVVAFFDGDSVSTESITE